MAREGSERWRTGRPRRGLARSRKGGQRGRCGRDHHRLRMGEGNMILSILTPAVPSRMAQLMELGHELERQIGSLPVEHLVLLDKKRQHNWGEQRETHTKSG